MSVGWAPRLVPTAHNETITSPILCSLESLWRPLNWAPDHIREGRNRLGMTSYVRRMLQEPEILGCLGGHPNIVQLRCAAVSQQTLRIYIVMCLVQG